ncbi:MULTISPECIES: BppU family phage baseplate upper protein [Mammaliicoccus]|uniref:BppU family phage baseplate upper protein n=1 Tax=Mammaliicoccus TaxID=2803850 RepID=UPI000E0015CC|nr:MULTISPECIES: BppU family phage baseplate upper protein [Mammaliicoccus]RTX83967.1 DUF2479 domain-containing protein [Mammaliicoccus fleurettii]SUM36916.1 phage tail fiber [Mammaliicoccus fleurettii]HCN61622.1 hypothetical protein [Staphylococcus sp.]
MAIYINRDIKTSINEQSVKLGNIGANFYTEDNSTASIRIYIQKNGTPINLNSTGLTPHLDLFTQDGSVYTQEQIEIVSPEQGLVQYKISENVVKHAGRIDCKLFLENGKESVYFANFYIMIKDSEITGAISKEIQVEVLEDIVRDVMTDKTMGLLDNKLQTIKDNIDKVTGLTDDEAIQIFIDEMNKKVAQLGITTTKFLTPTGLTALGQLATAYDFNIITLHASAYNDIANIWGQKNYTFKIQGQNTRDVTATTTVTSPSVENTYQIVGGKTGTMGIIRNITTILKNGIDYYVVTVMRGQNDRFDDLKTALDEAIKKEKGEKYDSTIIGDTSTSFSILKYPRINPRFQIVIKPEILLSNKETVRQNPASMTKLMTSIIMLENMDNINQTITLKESDFVGGSGIPLQVGDKMTLKDALYLMLLPSSNDTAMAVARTIGNEIYYNRNKNY